MLPVSLAVLPVSLAVMLTTANLAAASRTETSPAPEFLVGWDAVGKVSAEYFGNERRGRATNYELDVFKFANTCSRKGSMVTATIRIRNKQFDLDGPHYFVSGNVIGRAANPRMIVGFASVSGPHCSSGPWWFEVKP